jgi:UPF0042 nucleotide-binding protein
MQQIKILKGILKMETTNTTQANNQNKQVIIVTGLSGAGKSGVLRGLEDLGFYCVDNLPVPMLSILLNLAFQTQTTTVKVALGIDSRNEQFLHNLIAEVQKLKDDLKDNLKIIFLSASTETLIKRYQETRRNHPMLGQESNLIKAIDKEKMLLAPIEKMADITLDTNSFNSHDLRNWVQASFSTDNARKLTVNLVSFGFKYGLPSESNIVHDLRFLPNPYFIPALKPLDGRNSQIQDYLFNQTVVQNYWDKVLDFTKYAVEHFYEEGRFYVTVSFGCTGGKHRSVSFVERMKQENWANVKFLVNHRDVGRE